MRSFRIPGRKVGRIATTAALLVATIVPSFAPAIASAAQLSDRSVELSSSATSATGVSYHIKFTQSTPRTNVIVQFCTNTPLIGEFCDSPTGMSLATVAAGAGVTSVTGSGSTLNITKLAATEDITVTGIVNPSAHGTVYARILTYIDSAAANVYAVTSSASAIGTPTDMGSVAFAITEAVEVSGAVLETLTFCVSAADIAADTNCANATSPVLALGEDAGDGTKALTSSQVSTGDIYTKISTNAVSGAVVSLKSTAGVNQPGNTPCAGLALYGTGACSIAAAGTTGALTDAADGTTPALFGVKITAPANDANNGNINVLTGYDGTNYNLNGAGAISTYGDPIYNTNGGYANNRNVLLTFGAKSAANTPAGKYSAKINLVATGTF